MERDAPDRYWSGPSIRLVESFLIRSVSRSLLIFWVWGYYFFVTDGGMKWLRTISLSIYTELHVWKKLK